MLHLLQLHLSIPAAAGDEEISRQELGLEDIGLVARVELEHFPGEELVGHQLSVWGSWGKAEAGLEPCGGKSPLARALLLSSNQQSKLEKIQKK